MNSNDRTIFSRTNFGSITVTIILIVDYLQIVFLIV